MVISQPVWSPSVARRRFAVHGTAGEPGGGVDHHQQLHLFAAGPELPGQLEGGKPAERPAADPVGAARLHAADLPGVVGRHLLDGGERLAGVLQAARLQAVERLVRASVAGEREEAEHVAAGRVDAEERPAPGAGGGGEGWRSPPGIARPGGGGSAPARSPLEPPPSASRWAGESLERREARRSRRASTAASGCASATGVAPASPTACDASVSSASGSSSRRMSGSAAAALSRIR